MPRLLDRYVIRLAVPPFLIALLVFTFILIVPFVVDLAEKLIAKGVPAGTVMFLLVTLLPQALAVTIPMALLVGILIALGRLSADRESVALQACGVSIFRIVRPVMMLAAVAWAATAWVIIVAVPDANQTFREITMRIISDRTEGEVKPRVFYEDFPYRVLYVRDVPKDGSGWRDVFLADLSDVNNVAVYLATSGHLVVDREKRTVELILEDGASHVTRVTENPSVYNVSKFNQIRLSLDPDTVFPRSGPQKGDAEMSIGELEARIAASRTLGVEAKAAIMAIQRKFSIPVACLVFAVIGVGLGLTTRRDGKLAGFALGIAVIFVYYGLLTTAQSATANAWMPPALAPWVPDIVLGILGAVVLVARGASGRRWRARVGGFRRAGGWAGRLASAAAGRLFGGSSRGAAGTGTRVSGGWRSLMPRGATILDVYLGQMYLRVFALTFFGLLLLFYVSSFIEMSEKVFRKPSLMPVLGHYLYWSTPQFVYYCIPLAVLIGTLVTIGLLTRSSELTVMRACGISLYRTVVPLVVFGLVASAALFTLEERVLAGANRRAQALGQEIRSGSARTFDMANRKWLVGRNGDIYNYIFFDVPRAELKALSIYRFAPKSWRLQNRTFYRVATFPGTSTGSEALVTWTFTNGWSRDFDRQAGERTFRETPAGAFQMEPPQYFVTEQVDADRMNYGQLSRYIAEMRTSGFNVLPYECGLYRKISFPWVTLIMTLLAVPFGVSTGRRGAMYGIGLGIALAVVYWVSDSFFGALGTGGLLFPMLAAWAANVIFAAVATYLLLTVRT